MKNRIAWTEDGLLFVIRKGKTTNAKISDGTKPIVQTYTFDMRQYDLANCGRKITPSEFFALDIKNCLDCPLSGNRNNGVGKCYTHKYMQFSGFLSMLRSIHKTDSIQPELTAEMRATAALWSVDSFVRFGTYGEPSLFPIDLVQSLALNASTWSGYTHQARRSWAKPYADFFMASAHSDKEAISLVGWRSFVAYDSTESSAAVQCPASKESSYASNCAKCGLCSGVKGKGTKDVKILIH
tara:strand:+ start:554 stop:1273 length:720 start_codon:yes stop_codon:yes gene_type:complete